MSEGVRGLPVEPRPAAFCWPCLAAWGLIGVLLGLIGFGFWMGTPGREPTGWSDRPVKLAGKHPLLVGGHRWEITLNDDGTSVSRPKGPADAPRWIGAWCRSGNGIRVMEHEEGQRFAVVWTAHLDAGSGAWVLGWRGYSACDCVQGCGCSKCADACPCVNGGGRCGAGCCCVVEVAYSEPGVESERTTER